MATPIISQPVRRLLRLREAEQHLRKLGMFENPPSRQKLIALIQCGRLDGYYSDDLYCYLVFEDSLTRWVADSLNPPSLPKLSR